MRTRDHEHGSRIAIYVVRLDRSLTPIRHTHLHGWQRTVPRQHLCGTAVAVPEIRMCLPVCFGNRIGCPSRDRQVGRVLQPQTPSQCPWRQTALRGLLVRERRHATRSAGAKSSLTYAKTVQGLGNSSHHPNLSPPAAFADLISLAESQG